MSSVQRELVQHFTESKQQLDCDFQAGQKFIKEVYAEHLKELGDLIKGFESGK